MEEWEYIPLQRGYLMYNIKKKKSEELQTGLAAELFTLLKRETLKK